MPFHIQPIREFLVRPALAAFALPDDGAGLQHFMELGAAAARHLPAPGPGVVAGMRIQLGADAGPGIASHAGQGGCRCPLPGAVQAGLRDFRRSCQEGAAGGRRQADRLLFRRVWPDRVPAGVFGRPGHPFRRSSEVFERPGLPAGGHRAALSAGLFPPGAESGRVAAGALPDQRFLHAAAGPAQERGGPRPESHGAVAHRRRVHPGMETGCGAHRALPAGYQHSGERAAAGSRHHRFALRRRHRYAHPPGDRAGHRRHAGARGRRSEAHRVPHERRALGVPGAGAGAAIHGRRTS